MLIRMKQDHAAASGAGKNDGERSFAGQFSRLSFRDPRVAFFLQLPSAERTGALAAMLDGPGGQNLREEASGWVVQALSVKRLVPEHYAEWRPLVRDAMLFFGSHLSSARLAPKLIEQFELPANISPEKRLLRLIARVPGLQKLGQVIARNRHLNRALRRELTRLENDICDVSTEEIQTLIVQNLGPRLQQYQVEVDSKIFAEASVSAVVRFTWYNPQRQQRERGVFKVMKPYIPDCFAEDMELLARLAEHLGSRHREYGIAEHVLPETFQDVRRLLQHEVGFVREQTNLRKAAHIYHSAGSIRIPGVIRPLSTPTITALTEEHGEKITSAVTGMPSWRRSRVAERLIDAVIGIPLLTPGGSGMFHADPHAGNLLYNKRTGTLTLLDWALTAQISEEQRRQFAMLFLMILLRDTEGVCKFMESLSARGKKRPAWKKRIIREQVTEFFAERPFPALPRAVDVVRLLERTAWQGVRLPSQLVMLRKVLFTLDGIVHDIAGSTASLESVVVQRLLERWLKKPANLGWPLSVRDWLAVYWSALLYGNRLATGLMAGWPARAA